MSIDMAKAQLAQDDALELGAKQQAALQSLLDPGRPRANVVGLGLGVKWKRGEPTGDPALLVLVTHKVDKSQLTKADLVPSKLEGLLTDVLAVGHLFAGAGVSIQAATQTLAKRIRPAMGGYSVGHKDITAGTISTCVYDILPGGGTSPPAAGVGIPAHIYILSNNHVLANVNAGAVGDAILQPGPYDGGANPADLIAQLSRFIPLQLEPPVPRAQHNNLVDAALAEGSLDELNRAIYWQGHVRGWRPKAQVTVGTVIQKTGRTTGFTTGRITSVNATLDVNYGDGRVGRLHEQMVLTAMSAGGDSGSLITTPDRVALGLLFAGSTQATIANQIENVRTLLRIEVAEAIL